MTFAEIIEEQTGYHCITSFGMDFGIAERFGVNAILDTYRQFFNGAKNNVKYFTELVLVLNWKICQWYESNEVYAKLYDQLWREADEYGCEHFTGEDAEYYYKTLD